MTRSSASWVVLVAEIAITAPLLLLLFLTIALASAQSPDDIAVRISPGEVNQYERYTLNVTGPANTPFVLEIAGRSGFYIALHETLGPTGAWQSEYIAYYDFGRYEIRATMGNGTSLALLDVVCDDRCRVDLLNRWGYEQARVQGDVAARYGLFVLLIVIALQFPQAAVYFSRQAKQAKREGRLTAKEMLLAPAAMYRGFIQPGSQAVRPDVNQSIALDLERRELMEQLRDALGRKFMGWDPNHIALIERLVRGLRKAYDREAQAKPPAPPPWQPKYEPKKIDRAGFARVAMRQERKMTTMQTEAERLRKFDEEIDRALKNGTRMRTTIGAWFLLIVLGIPALLMAVLGPLSWAGFYVEPLRPLWRPWFGDDGKFVLGVLGFVGTTWNMIRTRRRLKGA